MNGPTTSLEAPRLTLVVLTSTVTRCGAPEASPEVHNDDEEVQETQAITEPERSKPDIHKISLALGHAVGLQSSITLNAESFDAFKAAVNALASATNGPSSTADGDSVDGDVPIQEAADWLSEEWDGKDPTCVGSSAHKASSAASRNKFRRMMDRIGASHEVAALSPELE